MTGTPLSRDHTSAAQSECIPPQPRRDTRGPSFFDAVMNSKPSSAYPFCPPNVMRATGGLDNAVWAPHNPPRLVLPTPAVPGYGALTVTPPTVAADVAKATVTSG